MRLNITLKSGKGKIAFLIRSVCDLKVHRIYIFKNDSVHKKLPKRNPWLLIRGTLSARLHLTQVSLKVEKRKRVVCYSSHGGDSAKLRTRGISWCLWLKPSSLHAWWPAEESFRGVVKGGEERYRLSASSTWQRGTLSFCRSMRLDVSTSNK